MSSQQKFVAALLNAELPPPAGLLTWNGSDPAARFAVYRNNVQVSLVNALADTFPVTQALVGEAFFRAMAQLYVKAEPPRSRVLAFYGVSFARFIEQFPPAATVPYLADVARLEMQRVHAYHATDALALSADSIAQVLTDGENLPRLQIQFHPALSLLKSPYAVVSLWAAHQGIADISTIDPYTPETALVIRPQLEVEAIRLHASAGDFVAQLLQGATLGMAMEQTSRDHQDFDLTAILGLLIRSQTILSMHL
ncbi:MAG: DUF2063 domain-containing protein [Methylophilaceae bacterium]|nr:DUF2063 domain-containing protein [Methylophilaceae bacterium]